MKVWEVVIIGGVILVAAMVVMKASSPKAMPVNSSFGAPGTAINGLAAGIGGLLAGLASRPTASGFGTTVVPNEGTYGTGYGDIITGNTLTDPNTGKTLIYGTD
jgi:hypothetical protein